MKYIIGVLFLMVFVPGSIILELIACISPETRNGIYKILAINYEEKI